MEHSLCGGDGDDDVRLHERPVDVRFGAEVGRHGNELGRLRVVHLDPPTEAARQLGVDEGLHLSPARAALEPARDEDRLRLGRNPRTLELADGRRDRRLPRVGRRPRDGQRRRFDDDRRAPAARHERLERLAGEREAQRVAHGRRDVGDRLARRRRREHGGILVRVDDRDPGADEKRDARHGRAR